MSQRHVAGAIPERFVEVDAARLLLVLHHFSDDRPDVLQHEPFFPAHAVEKHLSPEYYLQKIDFLVRYPAYLAYELIELHEIGHAPASDKNEVQSQVAEILCNEEPELRTKPFRKFWYGAYERLREVEAWWHARALVFVGTERRSDGKPTKHYFSTADASLVCDRLARDIPHANWYDKRIQLIKKFYQGLTASEIKKLQYSHPEYRDAQLVRSIPNLSLDQVVQRYEQVMGCSLNCTQGQRNAG